MSHKNRNNNDSDIRKNDNYLLSVYLPIYGGARGVIVIVGNGHGDTSSNSGRDWLHFT